MILGLVLHSPQGLLPGVCPLLHPVPRPQLKPHFQEYQQQETTSFHTEKLKQRFQALVIKQFYEIENLNLKL